MKFKNLEKLLSTAVKTATGKKRLSISFSEPLDPKFGDLSTTIALELAKPLKKQPRQIAEEMVKALGKVNLIERTEIAGPGYINFFLTDQVFGKAFQDLYKKIEQEKLGQLKIGKGKVVITDTSNPNVAKPMGVHHLLATVIGQTVNNLVQTCGYTLIKDNYLGDWGTQFGKLMVAISKWGSIEEIKKNPIPELLKLYVQFHDEAEESDSSLEKEARAEFKKLEDGDPESRKLWEWIRELSLQSFQKIWDRLSVSFDMIHGEAYYEPMMKPLIEEAAKKGVAIKGEGGSLIIPMNDPNLPPCIIQKSDGATTYATRDLARIKDWKETYHADMGVVLCDIAQKLHHDQVNEAADRLEWNTKESIRVHFGRMNFPEGGMSTRKGKVVLLEDVLDEAEKRAYQKITDHRSELPEPEKKELAQKMGIGAIKYNILSQNRFKNYTFNWDQMLSFEGNSAPYLQYAYTRTQSVLRKAEELRITNHESRIPPLSFRPVRLASTSRGSLRATALVEESLSLALEEKNLIKKLLNFEQMIEQSLKQWKPNLLCTYLFELAQVFSHFYNNLRILEAETLEKKSLRLALVKATGVVLKHGLGILGIEVPSIM